MTERIDLDELADEPDEETAANPGDWIWRDDAPPDAAPAPAEAADSSTDGAGAETETDMAGADTSGDSEGGASGETNSATTPRPSSSDEPRDTRAIPHVPHPSKDKPVGIPVDGGGAGGSPTAGGRSADSPESASASDPRSAKSASSSSGKSDGTESDSAEPSADGTSAWASDEPDASEPPADSGGPGGQSASGTAGASGPHGGGADDMTLAFTFDAIQRFEDPAAVLADASHWADWIGIVGDVDAHVINKFQRDHQLDVDFFNGTGTGPGERLAEIGPHSMFFADRMALVGVPGTDESIADHADWEFVPLETAASEADWAVTPE